LIGCPLTESIIEKETSKYSSQGTFGGNFPSGLKASPPLMAPQVNPKPEFPVQVPVHVIFALSAKIPLRKNSKNKYYFFQ